MGERLRSNEQAVYRMINAALLTSMAMFGAGDFLGTGGGIHLFTALAAVALLTGMNFMAARGRLLCAAILLGLACAGMTIAGWGEGFAFLRGFLPWLLGGRAEASSGDVPMPLGAASMPPGTVREEWIFGYRMLQSAMVAAVCYAVEILFEKLPLLKRIFAAVILSVLLAAMALRWELGHFAVVFLLAYLLLILVEWIQSRWEKVRREGNSKEAHTLWIMPFVGLYLALMAAMPVPEEPYDWMWAKNICNRIGDTFVTLTQNLKWGGREGFGVAFSGFSEDGGLGGNLQQDADGVMTVWVQPGLGRGGPEHLYLMGSVSDTFDGRSWSRQRQGLPGEAFLDTAQTLYAVRRWNREYQKDYLREVSLEIRYEDFNTGFLFAPLKTWDLEQWDGKALDYAASGEELRWKGRKGYGTEYRVQYFVMNLGQQAFDLFLEQTSGGTYGQAWEQAERKEADKGIWISVLQECRRRNGQEFTVEDIEAYREAVYRDYLGEVELSPEAERCLREMTEAAGTRIEKLRAIERGLASLSYTRTPGDLPEWVTGEGEFLDYFLLESGQGYCTYFATAFVLLARAEGIPARYVQGYCIPVQEGRASVDSGMAHAWPEAYLEGVGWIPFEPTPGYDGQRYAPWKMEQPLEGGIPEERRNPGQEAHAGEGMGLSADSSSEPDGTVEERREEPGLEDAGAGRIGRFSWKLPVLAVLAILLACAAFWILDGLLYRYRYRKMGPEEKLRTEVFRNLEILRWFGPERESWETLQEVGERFRHLPGLREEKPIGFLESYESVIYGGKQADEDMAKEAARDGDRFLALLKARKRWAYIYCCLKMHR